MQPLFLRAGRQLALSLTVSLLTLASAQAVKDTDPLERSNPDYSSVSYYASRNVPTQGDLKAYQTMQAMFKDSKYISPTPAFFGDILQAQQNGIELKTFSDFALYIKTKSWLKGVTPNKDQFDASLKLDKLFEGFQFSPDGTSFQVFLDARKAGIEFKTRDELFSYADAKSILRGDAPPTPFQFQAYLQLKGQYTYSKPSKDEINQLAQKLKEQASK